MVSTLHSLGPHSIVCPSDAQDEEPPEQRSGPECGYGAVLIHKWHERGSMEHRPRNAPLHADIAGGSRDGHGGSAHAVLMS